MKRIFFLCILIGALFIAFLVFRELGRFHIFQPVADYVASSTQAFNDSQATTSAASADSSDGTYSGMKTLQIVAPKVTLNAFVADTPQTEEKGLGDRDSLPQDEGMLFVFDRPGMYGFWMKDMRFAIDMVWIGADKDVVSVSRNVPPDSYPSVFFPASPATYVLELNAGGAEKAGIATGTVLKF